MPRKIRKNDNDMEQSPFKEQGNLELKDSDIMQLYSAQKKFNEFVQTLGDNAFVPLNEGNFRYSKEIQQGVITQASVTRLVNTRVDKMIKNHRLKRNWGKQDCVILAWVLQKLTNGRHLKSPQKLKKFYWQAASQVIPGSTAEECMFKWLSMKKIKLQNHKWQTSESRLLQKLVEEFGTDDWKQISRRLYYANSSQDKKYRHPKQCRQQWNCYLNPNLKKGPWQPYEDLQLLTLVKKEQGRRKWSDFSKSIEGRTQNALKNRYAFLIQNRKERYPEASQIQLIRICHQQIRQKYPNIMVKQQRQIEEVERMEYTPIINHSESPLAQARLKEQHDEASMILSGDFTTTAFKKPVHENEDSESIKKEKKQEKPEPMFKDIQKLYFDDRSKFEVKECSVDEILKFMKKNRDPLIPARLGKNKELVPLFLEHNRNSDI